MTTEHFCKIKMERPIFTKTVFIKVYKTLTKPNISFTTVDFLKPQCYLEMNVHYHHHYNDEQ